MRLYVASWLQADIQSPEIDFRLTPNNGHSEAHAGLPLLTLTGSRGWRISSVSIRQTRLAQAIEETRALGLVAEAEEPAKQGA